MKTKTSEEDAKEAARRWEAALQEAEGDLFWVELIGCFSVGLVFFVENNYVLVCFFKQIV